MTTTESPDRAEIETAIQAYFDGLYDGDAGKLAAVFHESASLTFEQQGNAVAWPLEAWLKMVRERPSPRSKGLVRDDAILMLDQSSPVTAFVKVKCQTPPAYFTDYLCLVKAGGTWRIAQKVFATVVRK